MAEGARKSLRCAIYTRKSSEEGLEQSFNSLDAQREACAAFIASQRHEGWKALEARYDDGGYSGGSMERPALKALLSDLDAGKIDVVVVYKVDRLTRSLADFAKMMERFDARRASFVSVTQQFNTTSSMGRLTLNVLLSFAQFEREVTGERIRDKIAASKKKGMWMGGSVPLGYDCRDRKLIPNKNEAKIVQAIFERYLALGCVRKLRTELCTKGVRSKRRVSQAGKTSGGVPYSRGALYSILQNRIYIGEIAHRGSVYAGQHPGIVLKGLWDKVQSRLQANGQARRNGVHAKAPSLLAGLLYDAAGERFTPLHTTKDGKRYRYYASQSVIRNGPAGAKSIARIPAHEIEELITKRLQSLLTAPREMLEVAGALDAPASQQQALLRGAKEIAKTWPKRPTPARRMFLEAVMQRITVTESAVEIMLRPNSLRTALLGNAPPSARLSVGAEPSGTVDDALTLRVEARLIRDRGEARIVLPSGASDDDAVRPDPALLKAIARGQRWYEALVTGEATSIEAIAKTVGFEGSYVRRLMGLAFLAPDIVHSLLEGKRPPSLTLEKLRRGVPIDWEEQRTLLIHRGSGSARGTYQ